jgi:hypothetical protein
LWPFWSVLRSPVFVLRVGFPSGAAVVGAAGGAPAAVDSAAGFFSPEEQAAARRVRAKSGLYERRVM